MIVRFGVVSGVGWLVDFCLYAVFCWEGVPVWVANILGASVAVLFVFFTSVRHVFECKSGFLFGKLIAYIIYQMIAILAASFLINLLCQSMSVSPMVSKITVTPLTFYANFQFMSFITTGKLRVI